MDISKIALASEAQTVFLHKIEQSLKLCVFGGSSSLGKASLYYSIGHKMYFTCFLFPMEIINEVLDEKIRTVCLEQRIDSSDLCSLDTLFIHKSLHKKPQTRTKQKQNQTSTLGF